MRHPGYWSIVALGGCACTALHADAMEAGAGGRVRYTLASFWQVVEQADPALAALRAERAIADGASVQAGLRPNPTLDVTSESIGSRQREETLALAQPIELGGKRAARQNLAARGMALVDARVTAARAGLYAKVKRRYAQVLAAQATFEQSEVARALAERAQAAVETQIAAGRLAAVARTRARIELAHAVLAHTRASAAVRDARQRLAILASLAEPDVDVVGSLAEVPQLPPRREFSRYVSAAPAVYTAQEEIARREAEVALEQAQRFGNLTLSAGVRHLAESDTAAGVVGLSIPIPLVDRNQGNIARAQGALSQALSAEQAARRDLEDELNARYFDYEMALATVHAVRDDIEPAAAATLAATERGFALGKFSLSDVIEARRSLVQARLELIAAQLAAHLAEASVVRLLGLVPGAP